MPLPTAPAAWSPPPPTTATPKVTGDPKILRHVLVHYHGVARAWRVGGAVGDRREVLLRHDPVRARVPVAHLREDELVENAVLEVGPAAPLALLGEPLAVLGVLHGRLEERLLQAPLFVHALVQAVVDAVEELGHGHQHRGPDDLDVVQQRVHALGEAQLYQSHGEMLAESVASYEKALELDAGFGFM